MSKTAIVIGGTGLVGREIVRQLLENPAYSKVTVLLRRPLEWQHAKLQQEVFDFEHPDPSLLKGDELFCAMGTTLRKAGSKEAQYRIDCHYPAEAGRLARAQGVRQYLLVSSVGADAQSSNFYLRTKGDLEQKIAALSFEHFVSARPSFLLGDREEFRLGEKIGIALARLFKYLIPKKYRGVPAAQVAAALIAAAQEDTLGVVFLENEAILDC